MAFQIDQSSKIEQTNKNTTLALANGDEFVVIISGKTKRKLQELFRQKGKPRIFVYEVFAASVVILIKEAKYKHEEVVIDTEYLGQEKIIQSIINKMFKKIHKKPPRISFRSIGKKNKAHNLAYLTAKNIKKPNKIITLNEIKEIISL